LARSAKVVQVPGAGVPAGCPAMTGSMPPSRELPDNHEPNPGPLGGRRLAHTVPLSHILPDNASYHATCPAGGRSRLLLVRVAAERSATGQRDRAAVGPLERNAAIVADHPTGPAVFIRRKVLAPLDALGLLAVICSLKSMAILTISSATMK
jgi:hypothetical protein